MKKIAYPVIFVLLLGLCGHMMVGCNITGVNLIVKEDTGMKEEIPICGGTTNNTDYSAPKEIKSDKLVSLSVGFYHDFKYDRGHGMYYTFYVKVDESGKLILKDNGADKGFEIDCSVLDGAQEIIRKHNLAAVNGIHKTTAGLPPQYQPCFIEAQYDSGEYISYSANSDPSSEWGEDFVNYFGRIMADNGVDKYLPPKIDGTIKRFKLEIQSDNILYTYATVNVPTKESKTSSADSVSGVDTNLYDVKLSRRIYDLSKEETVDRAAAEPSSEYYEGLMQIIDDYEIGDFENGYSVSDLIDSDNPMDYYHFYIEFENGNKVSGTSADPTMLQKFKALAEELVNYMNGYIDNRKK